MIVHRAVDDIVATVKLACVKRHTLAKDLRLVCFLPIRNADLPREMDSLCESVRLLVERRLLGCGTIVTLERKQLEAVNAEREVPNHCVRLVFAACCLVDRIGNRHRCHRP